MAETLKVVIAEDNYLVREGVRRLLEDSEQIEVVATHKLPVDRRLEVTGNRRRKQHWKR